MHYLLGEQYIEISGISQKSMQILYDCKLVGP